VSVSTSDVFSKWAIFPEQHDLHTKAAEVGSAEAKNTMDTSRFVAQESFWTEHGSLLGITPSTTMELKQVRPTKQGLDSVSQMTYNQVVDGVKVFGGEFRMTVGAHGGVVNAHGVPLRSSGTREYAPSQREEITARPIDAALTEQLFRAVEGHVLLTQGVGVTVTGTGRDPASPSDSPGRAVELVWYSPTMTQGRVQEGSWALSYFLRGVHATSTTAASTTSASSTSSKGGGSDIQIDPSSIPAEVAREEPVTMVYDVFVDARTLAVVDLFDKSSRYSTPFTNPLGRVVEVTDEPTGSVIFNSASAFPTNDEEMDLLVTTSLYVSNLMHSISGGEYQTWAKADTTLNIETNLEVSNAYFDGDWGIHFGTGYITDDVVAHEWGHGYMETATEILYQYQPGAMDEAFADLLGESIDILNGDTSDVDAMRSSVYPPVCTTERGGTDAGKRWAMGEDITGGSIRDMYAPTCHYNGDSTYSPYYYCGASDYGGVHWNSGVVNRLYSVLVDGGVYAEVPGSGAGQVTISSIGMTKALSLFWTAYQELTPTAQFFDLAAALRQSCALLVGADIYAPNLLSTALTVSSESITSSDCLEVSICVQCIVADDNRLSEC
jgi:Zn-dependent metalloprotease